MNKFGNRNFYFPPQHFSLKKFIRESLAEDTGDGDHTSLACIPSNAMGKARLLVKEKGIIAGVKLASEIFRVTDRKLRFIALLHDGHRVKKGSVAFTVSGKLRSILKAERLVLNCMQRLSGIATQTDAMVRKCRGTNARILDTRKTTPGLRALEKWAVTLGGGYNHRFGLFDMILIKDNHSDCTGGVGKAILKAKQYLKLKKKKLQIVAEARNLSEVKEILRTGKVDRILLDNLSPAMVKKALKIIGNKTETEVSGGITLHKLRRYAHTGVDYISSGALTHSVKSLDLSLKAVIE